MKNNAPQNTSQGAVLRGLRLERVVLLTLVSLSKITLRMYFAYTRVCLVRHVKNTMLDHSVYTHGKPVKQSL